MKDKNNNVFALAIKYPIDKIAIVSAFFQKIGGDMRYIDILHRAETSEEHLLIYKLQKNFLAYESRQRVGGFVNIEILYVSP